MTSSGYQTLCHIGYQCLILANYYHTALWLWRSRSLFCFIVRSVVRNKQLSNKHIFTAVSYFPIDKRILCQYTYRRSYVNTHTEHILCQYTYRTSYVNKHTEHILCQYTYRKYPMSIHIQNISYVNTHTEHISIYPVFWGTAATIKLFTDTEWINKLLSVETEQLSACEGNVEWSTVCGLKDKYGILFYQAFLLLGKPKDM